MPVNISYISCKDANCTVDCQLLSGPWPLDVCVGSVYGGRKVQRLANGSIEFLQYHSFECDDSPTLQYCGVLMPNCPTETCIQYDAPFGEYQMYTVNHYPHTCQQYSESCTSYANGTSNCCRAAGTCDVAYDICD